MDIRETQFFYFAVVGLLVWLIITLMTLTMQLRSLIGWFAITASILLFLSLYASWVLSYRWRYGLAFTVFALAMAFLLNNTSFLAFDIAFIPLDSENMVFTYETWFLWALGGIVLLHFFLTVVVSRTLHTAKAKLVIWLIALAWVVQSSYTAFFTIAIIAIAHAFR